MIKLSVKWWRHLPVVERRLCGVALDAVVFDEEPHASVEGRGATGRLFAEEDLHRVSGREALDRVFTRDAHAAVGVVTVQQPVCGVKVDGVRSRGTPQIL